jgi:hypothetical protein
VHGKVRACTSPKVSLAQYIFGDAGRVFLSAWTTYFISICVEVSYGTVGCKSSCCTRVTTLDEIVKDERTLSTGGKDVRMRENPKRGLDLPVGEVRVRKRKLKARRTLRGAEE